MNKMTTEKPALTRQEIARLLNVSERTIDREIKRGNLKVIKVGNRVRISEEEFQRFKGEG